MQPKIWPRGKHQSRVINEVIKLVELEMGKQGKSVSGISKALIRALII